jgi:hypothetical protein
MSDKATLLQQAEEEFGGLRRAVEGLPENELRRPWLGTWGVREIAIHISGWHREMIPALERIARGEPAHPAGAYDDFDAWNARFVERKTGVKTGEVLAELDASHDALLTAAQGLAEAHFATGGAARDLFDGVGPGHYREHGAQIRQWRETHSSAG